MNIPPALAISLTGYLKSLAARNVSELTTTAYRTDLTQFFTWLAENDLTVTHPSYITRSHIIDYLSHLASQGRSGVTRARKLAVIREYGKFLVDEGDPGTQSLSRRPTKKPGSVTCSYAPLLYPSSNKHSLVGTQERMPVQSRKVPMR